MGNYSTKRYSSIVDAGISGGASSYADANSLPASPSEGDIALVTGTNKLYVYNGSAWFNIAIVNQAPTAITGNEASYELAMDGTPTVVTLVSTDPEGFPLTWSATTSGDTTVGTLTNTDNVFTVTPSTNEADAGTLSVTFSVTDGSNTETSISSFTLVFTSPLWGETVLSIGASTPSTHSYRYIKWSIQGNGGNSYTQASEFEIFDDTGTQIAISSATGNHYSTQTANRLIDGTLGGDYKWVYSGSVVDLTFDIGSQQTVGSYRWATGNDYPDRDPVDWSIQGSNDNTNWTTIHSVSDYSSTTSRDTFNDTLYFAPINNSGFIDRSTNAHTVTTSGTPVQTAFHPYLDNWSTSFPNGGNKYLTVAASSAFDFGTGDFTIECWYYHDAKTDSDTGRRYLIHTESSWGGTKWIMYTSYTGNVNKLLFYTYSDFVANGNTAMLISSTSFEVGNWYHIALTRSGNTFKIFIDGNLEDSSTRYTGSIGDTAYPTYIGGGPNQTNRMLAGSVSNLRIIKGTALYTSAFTPPTEKLTAVSGTSLLTCQSNRYIDNSGNNHAITIAGAPEISTYNPFGQGSEYTVGENKGSAYFDGSGDYLTIVDSEDFNLTSGSGDFTIEFWYYKTNESIAFIFSQRDGSTTELGVSLDDNLDVYTPGYVNIQYDSAAYQFDAGLALNAWNHIAYMRTGSTIRWFTNGVLKDSRTEPASLANYSNALYLGDWISGGREFQGYLSNFRITKSSVYSTSGFTPPTAPVGNTNASLYLPMDNAGIFDKTANNTLTLTGSTATSTTQTKFATTSMYAGGTMTTDNSVAHFGTYDFTMEGWFYMNSVSLGYQPFWSNYGTADQQGLGVITETSNRIAFYFSNGSSWSYNNHTLSYPIANQWFHLSIVRSGSTITAYYDGNSIGTANIGTNSTHDLTTGKFALGYYPYFPSGPRSLDGYIENFQILKGVAKYTTNFTPPTKTQGISYQAES